ncbi:MAG: hypothetical protein AAGL49_04970 [Pseudomonadota bacterium]
MIENIITDIVGIVTTVFMSGDWISTALAFAVAIGAAFTMNRFGQIWGVSLGALVLFGLLSLVLAIVLGGGEMPVTSRLESGWNQFMGMTAGGLLGYLIAFLIVIGASFAVRSAIKRT